MGKATFIPINYQDHYIRHRNSLGEISRVGSSLDASDAAWWMRPGLSGTPGSISFESRNYPGHFLRHQGYRIKLHRFYDGDDLFRQDASFVVYRRCCDYAGAPRNFLVFESVNRPTYFMRHTNSALWIAKDDRSDLFMKDSTWLHSPGAYFCFPHPSGARQCGEF
jgi:Alpha-L-arabinofuranosidase B (ABFB) domain